MIKFLWIVTLIGAILGGAGLILALLLPGAPQQAAAAAIAPGFAVIPYVIARAAEELR